MHVAAANPTALDITSVDPAALQRERAILTEQAAASGKPVQVVEKMGEGRLRKFYEETVLLEQLYVVDGESRVKDVVAKAAKELGAPVKLAGFVRYALGEGVEKKQEDFAAEVAAQLKRD
jgi:elongation factor Ts